MPLRSCLGCRNVREKGDLVRFALTPEGRITPDPSGSIKGRGAYICPEKKCFVAACKNKGAFSRAFRHNVPSPDADKLFELTGGDAAKRRHRT